MRHLRRVSLAAAMLLAACSGGGAADGSTGAATAAASLPPAAVSLDAIGETPRCCSYSQPTVDIKSGELLRLVEAGDTQHDFTIDTGGAVPAKPADQHVALQIHVDLVSPVSQAAINLPPGTYRFYCSIGLGDGSGHALNGMTGTITVH